MYLIFMNHHSDTAHSYWFSAEIAEANPSGLHCNLRFAFRMGVALPGQRRHSPRSRPEASEGVIDPFFWDEAAAGRAAGRIVMDEARVFGLRQGFCIPFHQHDGSEACISFGGGRLELSAGEQAAPHRIAIDATSTKAIMHRHRQAEPDAWTRSDLTARKMECLKWSAAGKTAWNLSVLPSLSRRAAEHHHANADTK